MTAAVSLVGVVVTLRLGDQDRTVEVQGAFDPIRSPEAAAACGRAIGQLLRETLERRLRHGEALS